MVVPHAVELSLHTFLTARARVSKSDPHPIFAGGARYIPPSLTREIDREAFEELSGLGLTRGKHLSDSLEDTFHIMDRPDVLLHAYIRTGDEQYGALVAGFGRDGVAAVCQDDRVRLQPMPRGVSPANFLLRQLPPYPPSRFTPFSVRQHEDRGEEARWLKEILAQPYYGLGELHTSSP